MTQRLQGTVALVTGASSGIGEATAMALAAEGATVAVAARRRDRLEALAERIGPDHDVLVVETDVTDESSARAMVERTVDQFGRLDTLVNNKTPKLVTIEYEVSVADQFLTVNLYPRVREGIREGLYFPNRNSNLCSRKYCNFADACCKEFGGSVD